VAFWRYAGGDLAQVRPGWEFGHVELLRSPCPGKLPASQALLIQEADVDCVTNVGVDDVPTGLRGSILICMHGGWVKDGGRAP